MTACCCRLIQPESRRRKKASGEGTASTSLQLPQEAPTLQGWSGTAMVSPLQGTSRARPQSSTRLSGNLGRVFAQDRITHARKGFFETAEFGAVLAGLPDAIKPLAEVAYITGLRIKSELLTRQWMHVDFEASWLRLEPDETKNREGRMFPLTANASRRARAPACADARDRARYEPGDPLGVPPGRATY